MKERKVGGAALATVLLAVVVAAVLLPMPGARRGQRLRAALEPLSATAEAAGISPWALAVQQVKEERGEPTGRQAPVDVPAELRHYSDTRRFLAVQVAEWREHRVSTPHDYGELALLIRRGELVELKPVGENYILYGVGGNANREPFTHYDKRTGKSIALYGEAELAEEYARLEQSLAAREGELASLREELKAVGARERSRRAELQARVSEKERALKSERERKEFLDAHYADHEGRRQLLADRETLEALAGDFSGRTYDLGDGRERREMKVRMLSFLRPEALAVMNEVAASYRQRFDRPLPITSLVRPDEYQHLLSKVNPNATRIETPPHSTGLAFDILYRYMTAEEQSHVMAELARLEDEGRIEVLRENRDHFHVFVFVDGARPNEELIRASLNKTAPARAADEEGERVSEKVARKEEKRKDEKKAGRKDVARKEVGRKKVAGRKEVSRAAKKQDRPARGKRR